MSYFSRIIELLIIFYVTLGIPSFIIGIANSNHAFVGSCGKPDTHIGQYTGLAFVYNLGCKAGKRVDIKKEKL